MFICSFVGRKLAPRVLLFSGKREDPGDEVRYFMDFGKGAKRDCNVWIWSVKGND